jgi:hypothetical protein
MRPSFGNTYVNVACSVKDQRQLVISASEHGKLTIWLKVRRDGGCSFLCHVSQQLTSPDKDSNGGRSNDLDQGHWIVRSWGITIRENGNVNVSQMIEGSRDGFGVVNHGWFDQTWKLIVWLNEEETAYGDAARNWDDSVFFGRSGKL